MDLFHDSDDRVPVAFVIQALELEPLSKRGAPWVVAIGKGFVDNDRGRLGSSISDFEEPALSQSRADGRKVPVAHHACQRYLLRDTVSGLARQKIKARIIGNRQRNSRDRPRVCHAGDRAHLLQLRVDKGHASVEVLVTEERRLERQQSFSTDSQIGVPQVLKSLQEQTAAYQ